MRTLKVIRRRLIALMLCACMVLSTGNFGGMAYAADDSAAGDYVEDTSLPEAASDDGQKPAVIISFVQLEDDVLRQEYTAGISEEELRLPKELKVELKDGAKPVKVPVKWTSEPGFDGYTEGEYVFTPKWKDDDEDEADLDYEVAEGVELPKITVSVVADESSADEETEPANEPETSAETEPANEPETSAETEAVSEPETGAGTEAASEPETGAETEVASEPETGAETEAVSEPETGAETELMSESETGAETELMSEPETGAETELMSESETGAETELMSEPETGDETELESETETSEEETVFLEPMVGLGAIDLIELSSLPTVPLGSLTITKKSVGGRDPDATWHFHVVFKDEEGNVIKAGIFQGDRRYDFFDEEENAYIVGLRDGQSWTALGLPFNTTYEITESATYDRYEPAETDGMEYYTTTITEEGGNPGDSRADGKGVITDDTPVHVTFTDELDASGDLTIVKKRTGGGNREAMWHFTLTLESQNGEPVSLDKSRIESERYSWKPSRSIVSETAGRYEIKIPDEESWTVSGLPVGTIYTVTEQEADMDGHTTTVEEIGDGIGDSNFDGKGTIIDGGSATVIFTNALDASGNLTVTKRVAEGINKNQRWNFTVTFKDAEGNPVDPAAIRSENCCYYYEDSAEHVTGTYKFQLNAYDGDNSWTAAGLQPGTTYTVTEDELAEGTYVAEITESRDGGESKPSNGTGTIEGKESVELTFTNGLSGSLTVAKKVTGKKIDRERVWHFTVKFEDKDGNPVDPVGEPVWGSNYNREKEKSVKTGPGQYEIEMCEERYVKSWTMPGLPDGTRYTVTEEEAEEVHWTTTITEKGKNTGESPSDGIGTIVGNEAAEVISLSEMDPTGSLTVMTRTRGGGHPRAVWHFEIAFTDAEGHPIDISHNMRMTDNTTGYTNKVKKDDTSCIETKLRDGETWTIFDLPAGTRYTVTETDGGLAGYTATIIESGRDTGGNPNDGTGTITGDENVEVLVTNALDASGDLTITKELIIEDGDEDEYKDWNFNITLTDRYGKPVNGGCFRVNEGGDVINSHGEPVAKDSYYKEYYAGADKIFFSDGTASVSLKKDEFIGIRIPEGATFHVVEQEANQGRYQTTIKEDGEDCGTQSNDGDGVIVADKTVNLTFTNDKTVSGNLTVKADVAGERGDPKKEWEIKVVLTDEKGEPLTGLKGENPEEPGTFSFTLRDGETWTLPNLPLSTHYTVTEIKPDDGDKEGARMYYSTATGGSEVRVEYDKEDGGKMRAQLIICEGDITGADTSPEVTFVNAWSEPVKTETTPGEGEPVKVGDEITYRIKYKNDSPTAIPIVITDELADEVDFVSTPESSDYEVSLEQKGYDKDYDRIKRVIWTLENVPANETGYVELTVKVNENAASESEIENHAYGLFGNAWSESGSNYVSNPMVGGNLTVTKKVDGNRGDTQRKWEFRVELRWPSVSGTYGDMEFTNGIATFKLKDGDTVTATGIPADTSYSVTEVEANQNGYTTTSTGSNGTIRSEGTASVTFTNTRGSGDLSVSATTENGTAGDEDKAWNFRVQLDDKSISGDFGGMTFEDGAAEFTLKPGETKKATGLPAGVGYTVTEDGTDKDNYTIDGQNTEGTIPTNGGVSATFTNTRGSGDLAVSKYVAGTGADTEKEWNFTVTLDDKSINETLGDMVFVNGVSTFTLKHGKTVTAEGIPAGVGYEVTEKEANQDNYATTQTGAKGTIKKNSAADAVFTNTKGKGNLSVSKTVDGNKGDTTKDWNFTVTLDDSSIEGKYGDMMFSEGKAVFTLKHGESKTAVGLPNGVGYTVTEKEANQGGYNMTQTGGDGVISSESTVIAEFTNTRGSGDLIVSATTENGTPGDENKEWHFHVELDDKSISGTYEGMEFKDGVAEFTLKPGETKEAKGLPAGVGYTVTQEEDPNYTTKKKNDTGEITPNVGVSAEFTNKREKGGLSVKVETKEGAPSDAEKEWHFKVELDDKSVSGDFGGMTFKDGVAEFTLKPGETKKAEGLPAGVGYTVTQEGEDPNYTTEKKNDTGKIAPNADVSAEFTNKREKGSLSVKTETEEGAPDDAEKEWHFKVELDDPTINGTYGDMEFKDGVAEFPLKPGESKTADGLPAGVGYTVTEAEANQDGYTTSSTGERGTTMKDNPVEAGFVNRKAAETTPGTDPTTSPEGSTPGTDPTTSPEEVTPGTDPTTSPETDSKSETEPETEAETKPETDAESESAEAQSETAESETQTAPKTGDNTPIAWYLFLWLGAAVVLGGTLGFKRRKTRG